MLHYHIDVWGFLIGKKDVLDYRYLAKSTGSSISISITYILFLLEMQKRQTLEKGSALRGKRYHKKIEAFIFTVLLQSTKFFTSGFKAAVFF